MDKASDFESEDCEFESRRGRRILGLYMIGVTATRGSACIAPTRTIGPWQVMAPILSPQYQNIDLEDEFLPPAFPWRPSFEAQYSRAWVVL